MTLEEALSKIGEGNVEAMVSIANYYNQQFADTNDSRILFDRALPWYEQAANRRHEYSKKQQLAYIFFTHIPLGKLWAYHMQKLIMKKKWAWLSG